MNLDWLAVLFRWMHVLAAVVAVGGVIFQRFVLLPAAKSTIDGDVRQRLHDAVTRRWKGVLMTCIGLLLASGLWNFFTISLPKAEHAPAYHGLFGVKFLAALAVFFIGSALVGRAAAFEGMRRARARWLTIAVALGVLVVLISGVLKNLG
jgi:uncharacterized membrane protein